MHGHMNFRPSSKHVYSGFLSLQKNYENVHKFQVSTAGFSYSHPALNSLKLTHPGGGGGGEERIIKVEHRGPSGPQSACYIRKPSGWFTQMKNKSSVGEQFLKF